MIQCKESDNSNLEIKQSDNPFIQALTDARTEHKITALAVAKAKGDLQKKEYIGPVELLFIPS